MLPTTAAVHPWLLSLRDDIFKAKAVARPQPYGAAASFEWMVVFAGAAGFGSGASRRPKHALEEKREWVANHGPPRPMPDSIRAAIERESGRAVVLLAERE